MATTEEIERVLDRLKNEEFRIIHTEKNIRSSFVNRNINFYLVSPVKS
ncbi:MAG: hypothetical protein ACOX40_00785 [Bacilli bacterium]